jgi:Fic family protein
MTTTWEPIRDLPSDWSVLSDGELRPLLQFWNDQRSDLEKSGALQQFSERLAREWAIETGQIEGVYNIDRGVTETLVERGISADLIPQTPGEKTPEVITAILNDHREVLEGLFEFIKGNRPLSKGYIHELHAALLRHQETTTAIDQFGNLFEARLLKGKYKERPNNPKRSNGAVHVYCPPEQVDSEMERLLEMHASQIKNQVPVEVEAAWIHHRFTQIHPYQDGNGRVARALASLSFIKAGWFPVVITRDDRPRYIDALEVADEGDLRSLVSLFADVQKRALFQAAQAAADVQQIHTIDEAIAALEPLLAGAGKRLDPSVWLKAKENANRLLGLVEERLKEVAISLEGRIGNNAPGLFFRVGPGFISLPAAGLAYRPNTVDYEVMGALQISGERTATIQVQAHAVGSKFRGLIGIIVVFNGPDHVTHTASKEPFQVNYAEPYESAESRFHPWLEDSLVNALNLWRKNL